MLRIWTHLLKKFLMGNLILYAVFIPWYDYHYKSCFLALDQERRYYQIGKPIAKFEATTT